MMHNCKKQALSFSMVLALVASLFAAPAIAQERALSGDGAWLDRGWTETTNNQCERQWVCTATSSISLHDDEDLTMSTNTSTNGNCSDNGYGDTVCRTCSATAPAATCSWAITAVEE